MKISVPIFASIIFLVLFTILIYWNSLNVPFVFDDIWGIVENKHIRSLNDPGAIWRWNPPRFISNLTFAVTHHFSGYNPAHFHLISIAIHLINTVLVFGLILQLSSKVMSDGGTHRHKAVLLALSATLFFSGHPIQTQAVTFIWQRFTLMAALFYLLTLFCYFTSLNLEARRAPYAYVFRITSFLTGFAAMFTKQNAFTVPVAVLLMEWLFFGNPLGKGRRIRSLIWVGYLFIIPLTTYIAGNLELSHIENIPAPNSPFAAFFTGLNVIRTYLFLIFVPLSQNLDYDYTLYTTFFNWPTLSAAFLHLSIVTFGICFFTRSRIVTYGILFFYLALSVESTFVPLEDVIFEHRVYLPLFGVILALTGMVGYILENKYLVRGYTALFLAGLCVSMVLGKLTWDRNRIWASEVSLWQDTANKSPLKVRPNVNLGRALYKAGKVRQALAVLKQTEQLDPDFSTRAGKLIPLFLALSHHSLGDEKSAEIYYQKAVDVTPHFAMVHLNYGIFNVVRNKWESARKLLETAYRLDPDRPEISLYLGRLYMDLQQPDAAKTVFRNSLEKNFNAWEIYRKMAMEMTAADPLLAARLVEKSLIAADSNKEEHHVRCGLLKESARLFRTAGQTGPAAYYETAAASCSSL